MQKPIYLTVPDRDALVRLVASRQPAHHDVKALVDLKVELDRAVVVAPAAVPADVVTMDSVVRLTDLDDGTQGEFTLVFPGSADFRRGRLSVLAPVGTALLGQREGDVVAWVVPVGRKRFRIDAVVYQPEADGPHAPRRRAAA